MERTAMSDREVERGVVWRRVVAGELRVREAAPLLGVCYRHARRRVARFRACGVKGLVHAARGRPSNRTVPPVYRAQVLELVRQHYGGPAARGPGQRFGPTLAAEHLWTDHGLRMPVTTLRGVRDDDGGRRHASPPDPLQPGGDDVGRRRGAAGVDRAARPAAGALPAAHHPWRQQHVAWMDRAMRRRGLPSVQPPIEILTPSHP